jgi:hypothetical protein
MTFLGTKIRTSNQMGLPFWMYTQTVIFGHKKRVKNQRRRKTWQQEI